MRSSSMPAITRRCPWGTTTRTGTWTSRSASSTGPGPRSRAPSGCSSTKTCFTEARGGRPPPSAAGGGLGNQRVEIGAVVFPHAGQEIVRERQHVRLRHALLPDAQDECGAGPEGLRRILVRSPVPDVLHAGHVSLDVHDLLD